MTNEVLDTAEMETLCRAGGEWRKGTGSEQGWRGEWDRGITYRESREERTEIMPQCCRDAMLLAWREIFVFISVEMNLLAYKLK